MTKVIISQSILDYRQAMVKVVEQVRRENTIAGVRPCSYELPVEAQPNVISFEPHMAGFLKPPRIEMLWPDIFIRNGQLDGLIQIRTSGDFGVMNVYVIITDDQGNLIESDFAMRNEYYMNHWGYILEADAGTIRSLTVQAIVMDCLGGMEMKRESTTL